MNDQQNNHSSIRTEHKSGLYRVFSLIFLLVYATVGVITFTTVYKAETGYLADSFQKILFYVIIAIGLILAAFAAFLVRKDGKMTYDSKVDNITSLILSIVTAGCGAMAALFAKTAKFLIGASVITVLEAVLLISALVAFLFNSAIWQRNKNRDAFALINGYAAVFFCVSAIAILYFDVSVEMNNPQKIFIQLSMAAICLSTLSEIKLKIYGKGLRMLIFAKLSAILLCSVAAVSAFTAFYFTSYKFFSKSYVFLAAILAVYAIAGAINLFFSKIEELPADEATEPTTVDEKKNEADPA